ncbi:hypothetical protein SESBI_46734 [Sesbania bispinosa]|nr:hypothetical protein SESBI_46734 [Sesbania bispinosa]
MSGDDLSDSQDLSKYVSLLYDTDTSATESDSTFNSDAIESSITSRPPPENIIPDKMPDLEILVINLSDEGSPVLNNENNIDNEDPSLSQGLDANQIVPKMYISFLSDVADRSSRYTTMSSILSFNKNTVITSPDLDKTILIEPCTENERICDSYLADDSVPFYTYLYDTFFTKLNLRLPFSDFEKSLLNILNVPPSQLHPNIKLPSSSELGWISFNNIPKKGVITTYTSSYKLWKQKFFRVRGIDASSNLLFDSNGSPHFPLFWSLEPHKVPQTPLSLLSEEDKAVVELLRKQKNIDCSALLENEDNSARLQALLGSMPPKSQTTKTMDEVEMIKALRARERKTKAAEKSGALSVECLGTGQAQGASSDVGSIFDRRFPIDQVVEKHLNRKEDRTRVHKAGMKNIGKKIQSAGAQMAFFGLCVDQYVGSTEKELKNLLVKNKELTEKLKNVEGDMKTVERLKADLQASEKKSTDLLAEKSTWDEKFSNLEKKNRDLQKKYDELLVESKNLGNKVSILTTEKKDLAAEKEMLTTELEDTKAQVAMQHTAGFEKVVSQLQFLYPNLKVDEVGAFKHIIDGKWVDIVVDEDEE